MKSKLGAFVIGSASASMLFGLGSGVIKLSAKFGLLMVGCYTAFCLVAGPLYAVRSVARREFSAMTAREWFLCPFIPFFLSPIFLASGLIAYDWMVERPVVRLSVIVGLFGLSLPFFLLFVRLNESTTK